ncbi:MAG TPA: DUF1554 domain-containing protein [Nannocystis sp.]
MPRPRAQIAAVTMALLTGCFVDPGAQLTTAAGTTSSTGATTATGGTTSAGTTTAADPTTSTGTTTSTSTSTSTGTSTDATTAAATTFSTDPTATSGTTEPETTTLETTGGRPFCGDGVVDPGEQCDDGNLVDGDGCDSCILKFLHVFVTSATYPGDLGGLEGADKLCNLHAKNAGLAGAYRAWLATFAGDEPKLRFKPQSVAYRLPDNKTVVADNFESLLEVGLGHPIDQTEYGDKLDTNDAECSTDHGVWTGLLNNGNSLGANCSAWTSSAFVNVGNAGHFDQPANWSSACNAPCNRPLRLYCFEQGS